MLPISPREQSGLMPVFYHKEALIHITRVAPRPGPTRQPLTLGATFGSGTECICKVGIEPRALDLAPFLYARL
jgi:hypothetical protein